MATAIDVLKTIWPDWQVDQKPLGRGSFGVVYRAVRMDHGVKSTAAIKVITIPSDSSEVETLRLEGLDFDATREYFAALVDDFVKEIQLMESLKGIQNIVSIEDYKVVERTDEFGWDIFIRMELLTPFNVYVSDRTLSEAEVIKLGMDICTALELCSRMNVIHRDIKPENIFVNQFGDFKLGDFGIARKLENLTGSMSRKGTINYMAPEVATSREYDARVDIYSLGLVLYRLLNRNRLPFLTDQKQVLSPIERQKAVERRIRGESLPPPCDASPAMADLLLKACAYDPNDRFSSAAEMKRALESVKNGDYDAAELNDLDGTITIENDSDYTVTIKNDLGGTIPVDKSIQNPVAKVEEQYDNTSDAQPPVEHPDHKKEDRNSSKPPTRLIAAVLVVAVILGAGLFVRGLLSGPNSPSQGEEPNGSQGSQSGQGSQSSSQGSQSGQGSQSSSQGSQSEQGSQGDVDDVSVLDESRRFYYSLTESGAQIDRYAGSEHDVSIPATLDGYPVVAIGANAFATNDLTSVTIPGSITSIGEGAFASNNLTSVTIPTGVTSIEDEAFYDNDLTSVTISSSVTSIGSRVFLFCNDLSSIEVDPSNPNYSSRDDVLFNKDQTELIEYPGGKEGSYSIPDGVISIGEYAFSNRLSIDKVTIPNSVTSIGNHAFEGCWINNVTISSSVTSIGAGAFSGCSLISLDVNQGNQNYISIDGVIFSKDQTELVEYTGRKEGSYSIPASVTSIGDCAFENCNELTGVEIPDGVTSIGSNAFKWCGLTDVTIPGSVTSIGEGAFAMNALTSVTIPNSVTSIGESTFSYNDLTNVTIPDSVTSIGDGAFDYNADLTSVTIPASVTSIGEDAFGVKLTDVYYGGSEEQWNTIQIINGSSKENYLLKANIHYNSTGPDASTLTQAG